MLPQPTHVYDLLIVGGGLGGMMCGHAGVTLFNMTVLVVEQGNICAQGASAAAKQGHVFVPHGMMATNEADLPLSKRFRVASHRIYREMVDAGHDIGLLELGNANIVAEESVILKVQFWLAYQISRLLSTLTPRLQTRDELRARHSLNGHGALWNEGSAMVTPCKVVEAARGIIERRGGHVRERVTITSMGHDGARYNVAFADGTRTLSRAVVVAAGTWHNSFVASHLTACAARVPHVGAVAGQIAIYDVPDRPPSPGVFSYSARSVLPAMLPMFGPYLQASRLRGCPWIPAYFLTQTCAEVSDEPIAEYLYSRHWGSRMSTGGRREPISDTSRCHGPTYSAPGVPYRRDHEAWAWARAASIWGIEDADAVKVEGYTACFPVTTDGRVHAERIACDDTFPNLFMLNGLAGGGIARGPGAGEHVARLVAEALGMGNGPSPEPARRLITPLAVSLVALAAVTGCWLQCASLSRGCSLGPRVGAHPTKELAIRRGRCEAMFARLMRRCALCVLVTIVLAVPVVVAASVLF